MSSSVTVNPSWKGFVSSTPRFLGAAFLIQALASLIAGLVLLQPLIVPGDITASMSDIASSPLQLQAAIVVEMVTAMGIVMLGALLYTVLKGQSRSVALVALGLYLLEAGLLAASRIPAFALLRVSQESVAAGHPETLQTLGNLLYEAQDFGYSLHMLAFSVGATLFYYLFFSLWIPAEGSAHLGPHRSPPGAGWDSDCAVGLRGSLGHVPSQLAL